MYFKNIAHDMLKSHNGLSLSQWHLVRNYG